MLKLVGLRFEVEAAAVDEAFPAGMAPAEGAMAIAEKKVKYIAENYDEAFIVGADTIVVLENHILGKPANREMAFEMLKQLSGKTHEVYTGIAVLQLPENRLVRAVECTRVTFRHLEDQEILEYVASGEPMDKAGAYGIQDQSAVFVEKINGCFYNVVGFPLARFYQVCKSYF